MYPKDFFTKAPAVKGGHCFVVMPFAHEHDNVYSAIRAALETANLQVTCHRADEVVGGGDVMTDVLRNLAEAEIVIADLTTRNANVFYELGIAHAVRSVESILLITQTKESVPFDVRNFRCIEYDLGSDGLRRLQDTIAKVIKERFLPYRFIFGLMEGGTQESERLLGNDRSMYSFAICDVMPAADAAQFRLDVFRHEPRQTKRVYSKLQPALLLGETLPIPRTSYALKFDGIVDRRAMFCVCNPNKASH